MYHKSPFSPSPLSFTITDFRRGEVHCGSPIWKGIKSIVQWATLFFCFFRCRWKRLRKSLETKTELCVLFFLIQEGHLFRFIKIFQIYWHECLVKAYTQYKINFFGNKEIKQNENIPQVHLFYYFISGAMSI